MTPSELAEAGQALWGDDWRQRMPDEFGVSRQTVWKWEVGKHPIPEIAVRFLRHLLAARSAAEPGQAQQPLALASDPAYPPRELSKEPAP